MQDFEKLGVFYLGKVYDTAAGTARDDLVLYDAKDLTTHAMMVGMTGSGKTGLALALLEEAAMDGIPCGSVRRDGRVWRIPVEGKFDRLSVTWDRENPFSA